MKKLLFLVILFLAGLAAAWFYLKEQEFVVVVSEAELQERIAELFPVEKRYAVVVTLRLRDPEVRLVEGADRVHYRMHASLSVPGVSQQLAGTGQVSGQVRYDPESRELFLDEAVVEDLDIDGVPSAYRGALREAANLIARDQLSRHPVYTLEEEVLEQLPGPVALRGVQVENGELHVALGLSQ